MKSRASDFLKRIEEDAAQHHHVKEGDLVDKTDQVFDGMQKECPICKTDDKQDIQMQHEKSPYDAFMDKTDKRWILDTKRSRSDSPYGEPEYGQVVVRAKTEKEAKEKAKEYEDLDGVEIIKVTPREKFGTEQMGYEKERKEFEDVHPEGFELEEPDPKKKKDWYLIDSDD